MTLLVGPEATGALAWASNFSAHDNEKMNGRQDVDRTGRGEKTRSRQSMNLIPEYG